MQPLCSTPFVHRVRGELTARRVTRAPGPPQLERIAVTDAHEGPVYAADEHALYFTTKPVPGDPPRVDIRRLDLATGAIATLRPDANVANGMVLGPDGDLIVCEQGSFAEPARISRVDRRTGATHTIVDSFDGRPLNSPNDVVVARDGAVWFTDPGYGHLQGFRPAPALGDHVYRHDPGTGATTIAAAGFDKPNGLAFSPDERTLYVADNGAPHHLLAFPVAGARLGPGRVIADGTPEHPDGLKVDAAGRIYASASTGVRIHGADGALLGEIHLPGTVNFAFGGPARNVLFITTDTAIFAAVLDTKGA
ncbi:MAG TPA: SMP-30/gluconolactonase/LRE family protein [Solirubrobacteraceae bacterium]